MTGPSLCRTKYNGGMRIERKGKVERLTPRLERFFIEALGGHSLDEVQSAEARRADYLCLRGLLAIELKSLEEDASERMDNLTEELQERPDWPVFLGSAPLEALLKHVNEPEEVKRQFLNRLGRAIRNHIHKANKQLAAHAAAFPRQNLVRMVVVVNEDHEIYEPQIVGYILHHLLTRRNADGTPFYPNIDAAMYFSERHAAVVNGQIAFPVLCVESVCLETSPWKDGVLDFVTAAWGRWSNVPLYRSASADAQSFETIDHIPEQMKRYEKWELDYRRNPYMRSFSKEQLQDRFDEMMCISTFAFLKDSPVKPPQEMIAWSMQSMSHIRLEMGRRAIPVTDFAFDPERFAQAAMRLKFPEYAIEWIRNHRKEEG